MEDSKIRELNTPMILAAVAFAIAGMLALKFKLPMTAGVAFAQALEFAHCGFDLNITDFLIRVYSQIKSRKNKKSKTVLLRHYKLLKITEFLYSAKNQKEIFEPIVGDWNEEYFEAFFKKETKKAYWINIRYTCAFFRAMIQKSPVGDLIEFIGKIAK